MWINFTMIRVFTVLMFPDVLIARTAALLASEEYLAGESPAQVAWV